MWGAVLSVYGDARELTLVKFFHAIHLGRLDILFIFILWCNKGVYPEIIIF